VSRAATSSTVTPLARPRHTAGFTLLDMTHSSPPPSLARLQHERATWQRWLALLKAGPLRALAALFPAPSGEAELWRGAARETSARLLLAGVRERIVAGASGAGGLRVDLGEGALELPLRRRGPFELHRPALGAEPLDPRIDDPLALAAELCREAGLDAEACVRIEAEVLDSVINLAQARLTRALRHEIARDPSRLGVGTADPRLRDPEHFVTDGHPWHPMTRTRLGLRRWEVLRYAAEQLADTPVGCVDVEAGLVRVSGSWPEESARWFGVPPAGFVRIPIHPASPPRLPGVFPALFERGAIRPVAQPPRPARSLLSLRTVAIDPTRHLKLACPVHTTSTRRVVSPMSVHNGPELSRLLAHIQSVDRETASLVLMPEPAAAGLEPEQVGPRASELGAICRVAPALAAGEEAWVCAAIGERWPGSEELVLERACAGYPGGRRERLEALVDAWIELLAVPALRLFSRWGVALEVHGQNTLAVVAEGRLRAIRVRDLGGIRIHRPRLRALACPQPSLAANSFIITDDLDEVRGKLEHTLFHAHLTCLFTTAAELGLDEARCWAKLRRLIDACYTRWRAEAGTDAQRRELAEDLEALTRPRVRAKALLRMRLVERSSDYDYTEVDNVLAASLDDE
jgi:siderophore synthetase component